MHWFLYMKAAVLVSEIEKIHLDGWVKSNALVSIPLIEYIHLNGKNLMNLFLFPKVAVTISKVRHTVSTWIIFCSE